MQDFISPDAKLGTITPDLQDKVEFVSLKMDKSLIKGVKMMDFVYCTPIQAKTLPLLLSGLDVAGQAQTGTGKTAAYLLAVFNRLISGSESNSRTKGTRPRGLILAPTRELAIQIYDDAKKLGKFSGLTFGLAYGGIDYQVQRETLSKGVDVLIGTPGRLIDYFKQGVFSLKNIDALVLDEADRMFDLGFIKDLRYLLRRVPHPSERLSMLFSATLSHRVTELAYEHMNNPRTVRINPEQRTAEHVTQKIFHISSDEKIRFLVNKLKQYPSLRCIIFINTKRMVTKVVEYLKANDFSARALSGDVDQSRRQKLIERFKNGSINVLVATDVAARGLHVDDVSLVINFDLPQNPEDYVHRIGRTARAGASGSALSLACEEYVFSLVEIEKYINSKIEVSQVSESLLTEIKKPKQKGKNKARFN